VDVGNSVRRALDEAGLGELDSAMLHACNAVDGTAKKIHPSLGSAARFTRLLRDNYLAVLEPFGFRGIDLVQTRFPVRLPNPKAPGGLPDLADVIYGIHRCHHAHGDALPDGFALLNDVSNVPAMSRMLLVEREPGREGTVVLSGRVIFGLVAVAVLAPENVGQSVPSSDYHLTYLAPDGVVLRFAINEWWGHAAEFADQMAEFPRPRVKLDFGHMMAGL
jgi:hypothetical protein